MAGNGNFVLDNLLPDKKIVPMIGVMPFGHATPFGAPVAAGAMNNDALFEDYVTTDVIPTAEAGYRVEPGRQNRAVAGLSMGGGQSLRIGPGHLDLFSAVATEGVHDYTVWRKYLAEFTPLLFRQCGERDV